MRYETVLTARLFFRVFEVTTPLSKISELPDAAFQELSKNLLKFDNRATPANLQCELKCLAVQWPWLKQSVLEEYNFRIVEEDPDVMQEAEMK